jgi:hypothetical protein
MVLILMLVALILLDVAAIRYGADSREDGEWPSDQSDNRLFAAR